MIKTYKSLNFYCIISKLDDPSIKEKHSKILTKVIYLFFISEANKDLNKDSSKYCISYDFICSIIVKFNKISTISKHGSLLFLC